MKPYDNYEITPCRRLDAENRPDPDGNTFEVCEPHEADVWTLYGHLPEGGVEAIGDFGAREDAEATFQRITGIPFGTHDEVAAHLRVMHAGTRLLTGLAGLLRAIGSLPVTILNGPFYDALREANAAIAVAEGKSLSNNGKESA